MIRTVPTLTVQDNNKQTNTLESEYDCNYECSHMVTENYETGYERDFDTLEWNGRVFTEDLHTFWTERIPRWKLVTSHLTSPIYGAKGSKLRRNSPEFI